MSGTEVLLIFVGVAQWVIGAYTGYMFALARVTNRITDVEAERDALLDELYGVAP